MRDYIINLQSRLLESQHEVPPPPSNVDGLQPGSHKQQQQQQQLQHVNTQPQQLQQNSATTPTLPRIAEMGSASGTPPQEQHGTHPLQRSPKLSDSYGFEQASKRIKTDMTPAQAALQGTAVLGQSQHQQPSSTSSR